jgi:hypothetical protein
VPLVGGKVDGGNYFAFTIDLVAAGAVGMDGGDVD